MPGLLLRCKNKGFAEEARRTPPCPAALISLEHLSVCLCVGFRGLQEHVCARLFSGCVCVCRASPLVGAWQMQS